MNENSQSALTFARIIYMAGKFIDEKAVFMRELLVRTFTFAPKFNAPASLL